MSVESKCASCVFFSRNEEGVGVPDGVGICTREVRTPLHYAKQHRFHTGTVKAVSEEFYCSEFQSRDEVEIFTTRDGLTRYEKPKGA